MGSRQIWSVNVLRHHTTAYEILLCVRIGSWGGENASRKGKNHVSTLRDRAQRAYIALCEKMHPGTFRRAALFFAGAEEDVNRTVLAPGVTSPGRV